MNLSGTKICGFAILTSVMILFLYCILLQNGYAETNVSSGVVNGIDVSKLTPQEIEAILEVARQNNINPQLFEKVEKTVEGNKEALKRQNEKKSVKEKEITQDKKKDEYKSVKEKEIIQDKKKEEYKGVKEKGLIEDKEKDKEEDKLLIEKGKEVVEDKEKPEEESYTKPETEKEKPLYIFGHKLLSGLPGTFEPLSNVPVSRDYVVGPDDEIEILMWGRINARYILKVDREGKINFPQIGPIQVAGLTFEEMSNVIIGKAESITGVNISVSMGKLRSIQVFVLGEVKSPGIYTVSSIATVSNALLYSGGPTELGSLRNIQVKRGKKLFSTIDLYDFMLKGDTSKDVRLMSQDVIFVPQAKTMVSVSGDVKRPAIYEFTDNPTLLTAVDLAGGLTPRALNHRVQIQRYHENRFQIILDIPYDQLKKAKDFSLKDGDQVKVFSIFDESRNSVVLYGNVKYPGQYAHKTGMRILDVVPDLEALNIDTYFDYALIKRYPLEAMGYSLIPFDLGKLILNNDDSQNILLEPRDEVYVFNKSMFVERTSAGIEGQVRDPGNYFIDSKGMRLKDLILKAGNLTRDAFMGIAHLYRIKKDTTEINLITLNLEKAMNGDPANNIILEDQDRIIVHNKWDFKEKYIVSIKGMVSNPGEYPYAENMTASDLIRIAGNVKTAAYMEEAELVRTNIIESRQVETSVIPFNITLALNNDPVHNKKLEPLDVITVKAIPDWWGLKNEVEITGEVFFPGRYNIRKGEKISELIQRAGGFTEYSYLQGAVFTRESEKKIQQQRIDDMLSRLEEDYARFSSQETQSALSKEDLATQGQFLAAQKALIAKLKLTKASGRVVLKMLPVKLFKNSSSDIKLQGGDSLYIPKEPATVNVLGAVYNPSSFTYNKDKTLKYYIAQTGGPTRNAEEESIYVVRVDGTVFSSRQEPSFFGASWSQDRKRWGFWEKFEELPINPGDTILVPEKIVKPTFMREVKDITEVLYQIAVIAGITITQIF